MLDILTSKLNDISIVDLCCALTVMTLLFSMVVLLCMLVVIPILYSCDNLRFVISKIISSWFQPKVVLTVIALSFIGWEIHRYVSNARIQHESHIQAYNKIVEGEK